MKIRTIVGLFFIAVASVAVSQPPWERGGGDRGDRGGRGGPGGSGGFDPSSFLDRMDQNKNGVIDPDEQQGGARFLIGRLSSVDSSIKEGTPIPVSKFKEAFEKCVVVEAIGVEAIGVEATGVDVTIVAAGMTIEVVEAGAMIRTAVNAMPKI